MKIPKKWLHIGTDHLTIEDFKPIKNDPVLPKPYGGIWASPLLLNNDKFSDWQKFSENVWGKARGKGVIFSFKKNTRFYVIDSQQDLINLIKEVGIAKSPIPYLNNIIIDFEKAKEVYDVIYLTDDGQALTRLPFQNREYNLYGWDVESCLILNPHVIGKQLTVSI